MFIAREQILDATLDTSLIPASSAFEFNRADLLTTRSPRRCPRREAVVPPPRLEPPWPARAAAPPPPAAASP
eukprot:11001205-Lingulodinium_polyedra.AAC.1